MASAAHVPARLSGAVSRKLLKSGVTGAGLFFLIIIIFTDLWSHGSLSRQEQGGQLEEVEKPGTSGLSGKAHTCPL